ncbi:MAG: ATP-binding cassette domain-containing protein [Pseudomonadota bacterium]
MAAGLRQPARGQQTPNAAWVSAFRLLVQETSNRLKVMFLLALLVVLASSALATLSPVILKLIVDRLTDSEALPGTYLTVALLVFAYAASHWLTRLFGELRALTIGLADQRLHRNLSLRLFKHVMTLPLRFHVDRKTGALSQTLANGLNGYRMVVQHLVLTVLPVLMEIAMMSTVLVVLGQPVFLGIILATLACYTIAFVIGAARLMSPARAVSSAHIDANALLTDSIINYETIKSFGAEPRMHQRMDDAFAQTESRWARFFRRKAMNGMLVGTIFAISLGFSLYVAVKEVQQGRMSLGDFVLVNAYMLQIFRPMEMLGFAFRDIAQGLAFIEKMIDVFREDPEQAAAKDGKEFLISSGELVFENVSFAYDDDRTILKDVSFKIPAGKTVALVGASGSGKSSLIRLLMRFWEPKSGRILIDGLPISEVSGASLRNAIAIVPQDTVLFNDTIAYNIAMGCAESSEEDIREAAKLADIHNFIAARPDGYRTMVGERGLKLSGGEKQRIAIARAALKKPSIFVFDEATSSLDSKTEQRILRNMEEVSRGTTTLVVAHRLSTIADADEILVLERGSVIEQGTHRDLIRQKGVYQTMWDTQQREPEEKFEEAV